MQYVYTCALWTHFNFRFSIYFLITYISCNRLDENTLSAQKQLLFAQRPSKCYCCGLPIRIVIESNLMKKWYKRCWWAPFQPKNWIWETWKNHWWCSSKVRNIINWNLFESFSLVSNPFSSPQTSSEFESKETRTASTHWNPTWTPGSKQKKVQTKRMKQRVNII